MTAFPALRGRIGVTISFQYCIIPCADVASARPPGIARDLNAATAPLLRATLRRLLRRGARLLRPARRLGGRRRLGRGGNSVIGPVSRLANGLAVRIRPAGEAD